MMRWLAALDLHRQKGPYAITIVVAWIAMALSGCSKPPVVSVMGPNGSLQILEVSSDLERQVDARELTIVGDADPAALQLTRRDGRIALALVPNATTVGLLRRVDALLAATPYIEWAWAAAPRPKDALSATILVGLVDPTLDRRLNRRIDHVVGAELAPAHYVIAGRWHASPAHAAESGSPDVNLPPFIHMIDIRFGLKNPDWRLDGIDVLATVQATWPAIRVAEMRVAWIAMINEVGSAPVYLANVVLHR